MGWITSVGGVLAGYASMGVPIEYLVAASFMAAAVCCSKIIMPETDKPNESFDGDIDADKPLTSLMPPLVVQL